MDAWTIYCDFDGTISLVDVVDALLARHGMPGWEALEQDWRTGRIGSRECLSGQVALLDFDHVEIGRFLDDIGIDPAFPEFVAAAERLGTPLEIVSDGLDHAIDVILRRHAIRGLSVAANHLRRVSTRRWALDSLWQAPGCSSGTCKCARVASARDEGRRALLIGDGASDFCAAASVDFVFAKNGLIDYCRSNAIAHVPISGFAEATALLPLLLSGELDASNQARARMAVA